jgi:hypothetical protein
MRAQITLEHRFMPKMLGREAREAGSGQYDNFARDGWAGRTRSSMTLKTPRGKRCKRMRYQCRRAQPGSRPSSTLILRKQHERGLVLLARARGAVWARAAAASRKLD